VLSDVLLTLGSGEYITGVISLELNVGWNSTNSFLAFDSRDGNTFGPTTPILISGSDVPYTAFGIFTVTSMPAGSRFQITNSGEFNFDSTPEPALALPVAAVLAGLVLYRRRRAAL
jgi:MYXO-CTERM domain-containing protein